MKTILKLGKDITDKEYELICCDNIVAVDTETTGLDFGQDKLCTIQIFSENFNTIIRYNKDKKYPNLIKMLQNADIIKIFHNAVFDVSFLMKNLMIDDVKNIICTRISSKLVNGLHHNNSLKPLLKEYLNVDINKDLQVSDWETEYLSKSQLDYAMNDVYYLNQLWNELKYELEKNNLLPIAQKIFDFIPIYIQLKIRGIDNIFTY